MKVLFDFEIDESVPHTHNDFLYKKVREFFIQKFEPVAEEIDNSLAKDDVAIVIITLTDNSLKTVPYNVPLHLIDKLNGCIEPQDFERFQDELIAKYGKHTQ